MKSVVNIFIMLNIQSLENLLKELPIFIVEISLIISFTAKVDFEKNKKLFDNQVLNLKMALHYIQYLHNFAPSSRLG